MENLNRIFEFNGMYIWKLCYFVEFIEIEELIFVVIVFDNFCRMRF